MSTTKLQAHWNRWEAKLLADTQLPGFIGAVPYLLAIRWFILLGIAARLFVHQAQYSILVWQSWTSLVVSLALALLETWRTIFRRTPSRTESVLLIAIDVVLISWINWQTAKSQSAFFLFYILPLLTAVEFLNWATVFLVMAYSAVFFALVVHALYPTDPDKLKPLPFFFKVFLAREAFFAGVVLLGSIMVRLNRLHIREIAKRRHELAIIVTLQKEFESIYSEADVIRLGLTRISEVTGASGVCAVTSSTGGLATVRLSGSAFRQPEIRRAARLVRPIVLAQSEPYVYQKRYPLGSTNRILVPDVQCLVGVPLRAHYRTLGTLIAAYSSSGAIHDDSIVLLEHVGTQMALAVERMQLQSGLDEAVRATRRGMQLEAELDDFVHKMAEDLGFDFVLLSLLDSATGMVRPIKARHIPQSWIRLSPARIESDDIDAEIIRSGKGRIVAGPHTPFKPALYTRFDHANMARLFLPLKVGGKCIGVMEAGCRLEAKALIFTLTKLKTVMSWTARLGNAISGLVARQSLAGLIADKAIAIIGADSASLHVFEGRRQTVAEGAGRATAEFLERHQPRPDGLGMRAVAADKPMVEDDATRLAELNPAIFAAGVRAVAAFPLNLGVGRVGLMYVHFWRPHRFSEHELRVEGVFAKHIEAAVHTELLVRGALEQVEHGWMLSRLQHVIHQLATNKEPRAVLDYVAQTALDVFDSNNVTLYQYDQSSKNFETPPILKGTFFAQGEMQHEIRTESILWRILGWQHSELISNVHDHKELLSAARKRTGFLQREKISSCAIALLRAGPGSEVVGIMFVNFCELYKFREHHRSTIDALASSAAIAITAARQSARIVNSLVMREKEIYSLADIDAEIVRSARMFNLDRVLKLILATAAELTGALVGAVMWSNRQDGTVSGRVLYGMPDEASVELRAGEGMVGRCIDTRAPIIVTDVTASEWLEIYRPVVPGMRSELVVPLLDGEECIGAINLEHPKPSSFEQDHLRSVRLLAAQAVICVHSSTLTGRLQSELRFKTSLAIVAAGIRDCWDDSEMLLRVVLTGITANEGLGFSRAFVFLCDERCLTMRGAVALGTQSRDGMSAGSSEEASEAGESPNEESLRRLVEAAKIYSRAISDGSAADCHLGTEIKKVAIPVSRGGALADCVLKSAVQIRGHEDEDPVRDILRTVSGGDAGSAFACIPLISEDLLGVVMVDDRFRPGERIIDPARVAAVRAYADLAAVCIQNSRLRLRAQTRAFQDLSHQMKGPIALAHSRIDGLVRMPNLSDDMKRDVLAIRAQIANARRVTGSVKLFADLAAGQSIRTDLSEMTAQAIDRVLMDAALDYEYSCDPRRGIRYEVNSRLPNDESIRLDVDRGLFEQAIGNVLDNAGKYSFPNTTVLIRCAVVGLKCVISIRNTGIELSREDAVRCVDREWRGDEAALLTWEGSGIGLWIVDGIMRAHGGTLTVVPTDSLGLTEIRLEFNARLAG